MSIGLLEPTTITDEMLKEMLESSVPCQAPQNLCLSKYQLPATWYYTHKDARPECTFQLCEMCIVMIRLILKMAMSTPEHSVKCEICGMAPIPVDDVVIGTL